jgi:RND family efflux transporter MFP subunit
LVTHSAERVPDRDSEISVKDPADPAAPPIVSNRGARMNIIATDSQLPDGGPARRRAWRRSALLIVPFGIATAIGIKLGTGDAPAAASAAMPAVSFVHPVARDVVEWDDYVGRFAPSRTVEVRPRVSGPITAVRFRDGEIVRQGQLLFLIDPRPFAAALSEAQASVASARSALALARTDLGRASRLVADEAVSAGEVDALRARVQAAQAALAGAEARQRARALDVEFTQVRAPISGRISDRRVDAGNLVAGGDAAGATLLTTINALDPIYFSFTGSEALFLKAQRQKRAGQSGAPAEIRLQDEPDYRWKGSIDFTDNGIDAGSGTIRGRAVVANPDYFLTPGLFGNMRLATTGTVRALLVPDIAVQTDQARKTVLAIGPGDVVAAKPVEFGPVIGGLRVIRSGLRAADRIVITGMQNAAPGTKVQPRAGRLADAPPATMPIAPPAAAQATFAAH